MITLYHYVKFIIKFLLGLILLPIWVLYAVTKYMIFKYTFNKELKICGLDKNTSKELSRGLKELLPIEILK